MGDIYTQGVQDEYTLLRQNVPSVNYIDVSGRACIRIWTVRDLKSWQEYSPFVVLHTVFAWRDVRYYPYTLEVHLGAYSQDKAYEGKRAI